MQKVWIISIIIGLIAATVIVKTMHHNKGNYVNLDIQQLLQNYVKESEGSGAAIGFIDNGHISYYTYGTKTIDNASPITQDTVFDIGSITKVFTTIALVDMVSEGLVSLDDPIEKYLPQLTIPQKDEAKITLRHLATHTSGLPRLPSNMQMKNPANPYADYTTEQLYTCLSSTDLSKKPGEICEYSNLGMGILGHILELIEHKPYEQVIQDRILTKLGMNHTAITLSPELQTQLASGHAMFKVVENWDLSALSGAGALRSTIKDMTQFLAANMGLVTTPLYPAMTTSHQEQFADTHNTVGLGWHITKQNNDQIIWHNGATGGYTSFLGFNMQTKRGVVILSNAHNSVDPLGLHILDPETYKLPTAPDAALMRDEYLQKFVGNFEYTPPNHPTSTFEVILIKGLLFALFKKEGNLRLVPFKENSFKLHGLPDDYMMNFTLDATGNVAEVDLVQPGNVSTKAYPKQAK